MQTSDLVHLCPAESRNLICVFQVVHAWPTKRCSGNEWFNQAELGSWNTQNEVMNHGVIFSSTLVFHSILYTDPCIKGSIYPLIAPLEKKMWCNPLPCLISRDAARFKELSRIKAFELLIKMCQMHLICLLLLFSLFTSLLCLRPVYRMLLLSLQVNSSFVLLPLTLILSTQCSNNEILGYFPYFSY